MVAITLRDSAGATDYPSGLQVTQSLTALPSGRDFSAASESLRVTRFVQPWIPAQGAPVNANPSFAGGLSTGWTVVNGFFAVSGSPPSGCPQQYAAQFTNNGIALGFIEGSIPFTLIPVTSPLMTCWVYSLSGLATIGFTWQNASHGTISTSTATFTVPPSTWVQLPYAANPPASAVYAIAMVGPDALSNSIWTTQVNVTFQAPLSTAPSPAVFVKQVMPVMHVQNLVTGQWLHRNVQGITQPSVTWNLNAADSFTCTLSPPRPDMMDPTGNPLLAEWRDACYLEQDGQLKWGGILTSSGITGPSWQMTFTGFAGYPAGITYEGANYTVTFREAMTVIRYLWQWVQSQYSNIGMVVDPKNTGVLLGAQLPSIPVTDRLGQPSATGSHQLWISHPDQFQQGMVIRVGNEGTTYTIASMVGHIANLTTRLKGVSSRYVTGAVVTQVVPPNPFSLYWYNSTDIGQEIEQIRQEAVFDWREVHKWADPAKTAVTHTWTTGVPRLGARRSELRFAEGENIVSPATTTRDGSAYADRVIGLGYGSGTTTVRADVSEDSGRLHRPYIYTNAGATTTARITVMARKQLLARHNIDTVTQITVKNHPNAPFGSFFVGDDIPVILCTSWRNALIWSRITSITQDPTTNLMTLTMARSDSFTYIAETGQGGTL
jgi:hypothetical protein